MAIVVTPPITFWILAGEGPYEAAAYLASSYSAASPPALIGIIGSSTIGNYL